MSVECEHMRASGELWRAEGNWENLRRKGGPPNPRVRPKAAHAAGYDPSTARAASISTSARGSRHTSRAAAACAARELSAWLRARSFQDIPRAAARAATKIRALACDGLARRPQCVPGTICARARRGTYRARLHKGPRRAREPCKHAHSRNQDKTGVPTALRRGLENGCCARSISSARHYLIEVGAVRAIIIAITAGGGKAACHQQCGRGMDNHVLA